MLVLLLLTRLLLFTDLQQSRVQATGLLSSSLMRFRETLCDGKMLYIYCPEGTLISIQFSQYGYSLSEHHMCGTMDTSFKDHSQGNGDRNCYLSNTLDVLLKMCQEKRRCQLRVKVKTFTTLSDPCPNRTKLLEVAYQCRPTEFHRNLACEDEQITLTCRRSSRIVVYYAKFRHFPSTKTNCSKPESYSLHNCKTPHAAEQAIQDCQGRKHCPIQVDSSTFENYCPSSSQKYLEIVYSCAPKRILKNELIRKFTESHINSQTWPSHHPLHHHHLHQHPHQHQEPIHLGIKEQYDSSGEDSRDRGSGRQFNNSGPLHKMKAILTMRPFHNKWRTSAPSSSTASSTTVATTTTTTTTTTASTSTTTTTTTFRTSIRNIAAGVLVIPTPSTPESKTEIDQRNSLGHDGLSPQHTDNVGSPERGVGRKGSVAESSSVAPLETQSNVDPNVHCVNTTHFVSKVKKQPASVLSDWLGVFYIIQKNKEKALLYFLLGISLGTICILLIVVVKLIFVNKRKLQAKLDLTEPTHSQNATPNNHVPKHSSPTALRRATSDEFVDFMGYSPRSGTLRTESGNRSLNYF